jgi:DNA-binding NarL/FixJ family response regulator
VTGDSTEDGRPGADPRRYPVLIIDDHELFSTTLGLALREEGLDASTLEVDDLQDFLARPPGGPRGLALLDLDLDRDAEGREVDGVDLVTPLRMRGWEVLVVTGGPAQGAVAAAVAAGAMGYVPKWHSFDVLLRRVMAAAEGSILMTQSERQVWLDRYRRDQAEEQQMSHLLSRLTPREREVLELLSTGMRAAAIAEHFVVTMATVRTQIRSILGKLEVGSQLEAVALLRR